MAIFTVAAELVRLGLCAERLQSARGAARVGQQGHRREWRAVRAAVGQAAAHRGLPPRSVAAARRGRRARRDAAAHGRNRRCQSQSAPLPLPKTPRRRLRRPGARATRFRSGSRVAVASRRVVRHGVRYMMSISFPSVMSNWADDVEDSAPPAAAPAAAAAAKPRCGRRGAVRGRAWQFPGTGRRQPARLAACASRAAPLRAAGCCCCGGARGLRAQRSASAGAAGSRGQTTLLVCCRPDARACVAQQLVCAPAPEGPHRRRRRRAAGVWRRRLRCVTAAAAAAPPLCPRSAQPRAAADSPPPHATAGASGGRDAGNGGDRGTRPEHAANTAHAHAALIPSRSIPRATAPPIRLRDRGRPAASRLAPDAGAELRCAPRGRVSKRKAALHCTLAGLAARALPGAC